MIIKKIIIVFVEKRESEEVKAMTSIDGENISSEDYQILLASKMHRLAVSERKTVYSCITTNNNKSKQRNISFEECNFNHTENKNCNQNNYYFKHKIINNMENNSNHISPSLPIGICKHRVLRNHLKYLMMWMIIVISVIIVSNQGMMVGARSAITNDDDIENSEISSLNSENNHNHLRSNTDSENSDEDSDDTVVNSDESDEGDDTSDDHHQVVNSIWSSRELEVIEKKILDGLGLQSIPPKHIVSIVLY